MDDLVPADPGARRSAFVLWVIGGVLGTVAVWWLSRYVESLTALARSDPDAAMRLFRTRVMPAVAVIVLIAIAAGAWLARYGLLILRSGEFPPQGMRSIAPAARRAGGPARTIGTLLAVAGGLMIVCPLVMVGIMLWLLR